MDIQEIRYQVGEAWKGAYSASTVYGNAAVVQDPDGLSVYRSLKSGNVGHPLTDQQWWFCIIDMSSIKAEADHLVEIDTEMTDNEAERVAAETQRESHETARINAENARISAEQARANAESARVQTEQNRVTQENLRINHEQARMGAEQQRVTREQQRVNQEASRVAAETQRQLNENNRVSAEQSRISAEATRVSQEEARVSAEAQRVVDFAESQAARQQAFEQSQAAKQQAYQHAEAAREQSFEETEDVRDAKVDAKVADITNLQDGMLFLNQGLGKYDNIREITLAQATEGKYVNTDGTETAAAGYGISEPLQLNAGDILLVPSAQAVPASVSVVARIVTRTYDKVINYAYTYREDYPELPQTATADYDQTLVYTAVYDSTGETPVLTGWTRAGQTYTTLPATHVVTESYYEPLVKQSVSAMPGTGYYVYLCPTGMTVVVSGLTATVAGGVAKVVGIGIFKNIASNFIGAPGQAVLAQAFAQQQAEIDGLKAAIANLGHALAMSVDVEDEYRICGEEMLILGEGAPTTYPVSKKQMYFDIENKRLYVATAVTASTNDWAPVTV